MTIYDYLMGQEFREYKVTSVYPQGATIHLTWGGGSSNYPLDDVLDFLKQEGIPLYEELREKYPEELV